ncbi:MAG TPA: maleylpyruvate isomerase family mycothiol-dependent enzyme [Candidatus Micrarchaeia archaeon]|nr:maleylpyruvate isomerase family mycothiol-dependent enzyme [Candidatus Micrarchaeia archaeon]
MAAAAERGSLGAAGPTCPGWLVRELLRHLGFVRRWARRCVAEALPARVEEPDDAGILRGGVADRELRSWLREGREGLVATLRRAPADLECWTVLDAPSPLQFGARRRGPETAIHRADLQRAVGAPTPVEAPWPRTGSTSG